MARIEDVAVSNRLWRWYSHPKGELCVNTDVAFKIICVTAGAATYRYKGDFGTTWTRSVRTIAAHAEPMEDAPQEPCAEAPPRCKAGCTPAKPCWERDCPAFDEPSPKTMSYVNTDYELAEARRRRDEAPEPIELRCEREHACGLWRLP